jgi:hypothetical protein
MGRTYLATLWLCLLPPTLRAQSDWFPLSQPWEDSSRTLTDASDLLIDFPGQHPAQARCRFDFMAWPAFRISC